MLLINDNVSLYQSPPQARRGTATRAAIAPQHLRLTLRAEEAAFRVNPSLRRVALLVDTSGSYGRGILQGIARYNRERGGAFTFFRQPTVAEAHGAEAPGAWLNRWAGDGILGCIESRDLARAVRQCGIPAINLGRSSCNPALPCVTIPDREVAALAFQHLRERGMRQFAFCGRPGTTGSVLDERGAQFRSLVEQAGYTCWSFHNVRTSRRGVAASWDEEQEQLAGWIANLPKPLGVMSCDDERGLQVLEACRGCGARIPDDVAVIGCDNDLAICDLAIPPLSSIDVNAEAVGYEGAALLDQMMNGVLPPEEPIEVAPRGVVTRQSTDLVASEDQEVARALRYIRANACRGLQVVDVLAHVLLSRASLQQRMKQVLGRTIHQEIQRVRLGRAKDLLAMSDMTIKQVARESGFASVQYMTRVFRAVTGETPARYRQRRSA